MAAQGRHEACPYSTQMQMNFACIYIPDFMVQAVVRSEPALRAREVAIVDGTAPLLAVVAVNEKARHAGVELGMTKLQVAQFPSVEVRRRSPAQEVAAHAALLDLGLSFSPRVEDTTADTVVLDLAGLEKLFRSPEKIACNLARRASELKLEAHIAVAANPEAAIHAARGFPGITLILPGQETERLGGLPLEVLAPSPEILETLHRWGVRTLSALAALPPVQLSERLGQEGVRLQRLARGIGLRSLVPAEAALSFEEGMELEHSVALLEPLAFILGRLLDQLCARLAARALATNELRLQLELEDPAGGGSVAEDHGPRTPDSGLQTPDKPARKKLHERTLRLPVPMRDSEVFLKLWLLNLKSDLPQAPILKVAMAAEPVKPRVAQGGLFFPLSPDPEKLELTLARIAGVVGKGNVGSPELVDTHRPGVFRMSRFTPPLDRDRRCGGKPACSPPSGQTPAPAGRLRSAPTMALRVFRPPLPATVEVRSGRPVRVRFSGVRGEVVSVAGPWRTSGDWWTEDAWEQEEWDVALKKWSVVSGQWSVAEDRGQRTTDQGRRTAGVALYRIYRDLANGSWFIRGTYD